jgi:hypothetical protein
MSANESDPSDTLKLKGYNREELARYLLRQLGGGIWEVELTKQHTLDAIQDALSLYSLWRPEPRYGAVTMLSNQKEYLKDVDVGYGIVVVDFVDSTPAPTEIFYGNLISPAPLFRTGLDEYDTFLRWRKTWQRVTSVQPDWLYDEHRRALYIHNPIERYHAGITSHWPYEKTENLPHLGAQWVKEYSLELARYTYGEVMSKFGNAIPGPLKDLQLDGQKRQNAETRLEKLRENLKAMSSSAPAQID